MSSHDPAGECEEALRKAAGLMAELSDEDVGRIFSSGVFGVLLSGILDPSEVKRFPSIAEFLLANKHRAQLVAAVRQAITSNYSFRACKDGKVGYVAPDWHQWPVGVMLIEGEAPFAGLMALYYKGELSYAIATRDARQGDEMGPDYFRFVSLSEAQQLLRDAPRPTKDNLGDPSDELRAMLRTKDNCEGHYQELLARYPWAFGFQYRKCQRHEALDDANVPDFTAIRTSDGGRDIIEVKPPFMPVTRKDGKLHGGFQDAWSQAERYLVFAREEKDYLNRKGLIFDRPRCLLVAGFDLQPEQVRRVRVKEQCNPAIQVVTYDDLLRVFEQTVRAFRRLEGPDPS